MKNADTNLSEKEIENIDVNISDLQSVEKKIKKQKNRDDKIFMDMLKATNKNHYTLNQMVDRKARILLSLNALILSLIIGKVLANHQIHDANFFLLLFFGLGSLVSIIYAMLAIIPDETHGKLTKDKIEKKKGNPLFYGNFKNMSEETYENTIMSMVDDKDFIYRSMIQDIYYLGQVLEKKRQYLAHSLYAFMIGLCISLLMSFVFRYLFTAQQLMESTLMK